MFFLFLKSLKEATTLKRLEIKPQYIWKPFSQQTAYVNQTELWFLLTLDIHVSISIHLWVLIWQYCTYYSPSRLFLLLFQPNMYDLWQEQVKIEKKRNAFFPQFIKKSWLLCLIFYCSPSVCLWWKSVCFQFVTLLLMVHYLLPFSDRAT